MAKQPKKASASGRRRALKNSFITRSGNRIKLHRSLTEKARVKRDMLAQRKAKYLASLPKGRVKRILYRLHPKRVFHYWFSREGGIMALKILGIGVVVGFLLIIGVFAYFRKDLPAIKDLSGDKVGGSITYYDRTGQTVLWQDYDGVKRVPVSGDNIADYMKKATIAVEDKNFYSHGAFDVTAIARAGVNDVFGKGGRQGGSTITQQLVKNSEGWTDDNTITRKVKELILAVELEREYSKDDILVGYLNLAPYGGVDYGVETAARDYFNKSAKDLTLAEAAFLAAMPKSPTLYSPFSDPQWNPAISESGFDKQALLDRQHYILDQMVDQNMITKDQATAAKDYNILATVQKLAPSKYQGIKAPYFVLAARDQLTKQYEGASKVGGWKVTTTLDLNLQNTAEQLVAKNQSTVVRYGGDSQAMVLEDVQTGQMLSLVGGSDFNNDQYGQMNFAHSVNISPGSSFKPYDYTSLIENTTNTGAGSVLYDVQQPLPGWPCTDKTKPLVNNPADPSGAQKCLWDYDFNYPGALTLRYALAGSRNVPAVKAMLTVGTDKVISTADSMMGDSNAYKCFAQGVDVNNATKDDQSTCYGSSAIGDGAYLHLDQHVNGLATLGRLGSYIPQTYILKIVNSSNKTIYNWTQPEGKQVVRPDSAYIVDDMLSDPNATYLSGVNKFQNWNGWKIAVKTGTTNDNFDGLMTSWTTRFAVASWVGYHTRTKALTSGGMETLTAPLTRGLMQAALTSLNTSPQNWVKPSGVKTGPAFVVRANPSSTTRGAIVPSGSTDIYPSWYQAKTSGSSTQTIDKVSGLLATSCTPELAKENANNANDSIYSADIFWPITSGGAAAGNTSLSDNVHNCSDQQPTINIVTSNQPCDANKPNDCYVIVNINQGTHPLTSDKFKGTLNVIIKGQTVATQEVDNPGAVTINFTPPDGTATSDAVTVQIVDSVLYSATDSTTVAYKTPPANNNGH